MHGAPRPNRPFVTGPPCSRLAQHCMFWSTMGPKCGGAPTGVLAEKIDAVSDTSPAKDLDARRQIAGSLGAMPLLAGVWLVRRLQGRVGHRGCWRLRLRLGVAGSCEGRLGQDRHLAKPGECSSGPHDLAPAPGSLCADPQITRASGQPADGRRRRHPHPWHRRLGARVLPQVPEPPP